MTGFFGGLFAMLDSPEVNPDRESQGGRIVKRWEHDDGSETIEPEPQPPGGERVYQCRCGSTTFRLHRHGGVCCAECNCLSANVHCRFHGLDLT